jgi:hypothetical protein
VKIKVRIKNKEAKNSFNITFDAIGYSQGVRKLMSDSATLFVNALASSVENETDDDFLGLYTYVKNLVQDNIECLDLIEEVELSRIKNSQGEKDEALSLLRSARDSCLTKTRTSFIELDPTLIQDDTKFVKLLVGILSVLLVALSIPVIYFSIFRKRKVKEKVDEKEEEIEEWLKDFYDD